MITFWKILKILGCVALLCFVVPIKIKTSNEYQFETYLKKFNKTYSNATERMQKLNAFQYAVANINKKNSNRTRDTEAVYGLTKFSDLTPDEFLAKHLREDISKRITLKQDARTTLEKRSTTKIGNIPLKVDWREKGVVTKIKNQESCGACWAFSVIENVESMYAIKTNNLTDFSVQEMIDCGSPYNDGCDGGDMCSLLSWLNITKQPILTQNEYPTDLQNEECKLMDTEEGVKIRSFTCKKYIDAEDLLLKSLAVGPVSVAINALSWQNYLGGIIQYHCDDSAKFLNHAVQIVGYDLTTEIPHYIVRNSWGEDFGENGYLYIAVGKNLCGLAHEVTSVIL